jgi:hypothetical protein
LLSIFKTPTISPDSKLSKEVSTLEIFLKEAREKIYLETDRANIAEHRTGVLAEELNNTIHMMNVEVDVESIASKYGALSNDELLENYRKDEE